jgi:hypothetical protein
VKLQVAGAVMVSKCVKSARKSESGKLCVIGPRPEIAPKLLLPALDPVNRTIDCGIAQPVMSFFFFRMFGIMRLGLQKHSKLIHWVAGN